MAKNCAYYLEQTLQYFKEKDYIKALEGAEQAISENPTNVQAWRYKFSAHLNLRNLDPGACSLIYRRSEDLITLHKDIRKNVEVRKAKDLLYIMSQKDEHGLYPELSQAKKILYDCKKGYFSFKNFETQVRHNIPASNRDVESIIQKYLYYDELETLDDNLSHKEIVLLYGNNKSLQNVISPIGELLAYCNNNLRNTSKYAPVKKLADDLNHHLNSYLKNKIDAQTLCKNFIASIEQTTRANKAFRHRSSRFIRIVRKILLGVFGLSTGGLGLWVKGAYSYRTTGKFTIFNDITITKAKVNKVDKAIKNILSLIKSEDLGNDATLTSHQKELLQMQEIISIL